MRLDRAVRMIGPVRVRVAEAGRPASKLCRVSVRPEMLSRRVQIPFAVFSDVSPDLLGNVGSQCVESRLGHARRTRFGVDALAQLRRPHRMAHDVIERLHDFVFVRKPETQLTTKSPDLSTLRMCSSRKWDDAKPEARGRSGSSGFSISPSRSSSNFVGAHSEASLNLAHPSRQKATCRITVSGRAVPRDI